MPQAAEAPGDPKTGSALAQELPVPVPAPTKKAPSHRLIRWRIRVSRTAEHPLVRIAVLFTGPLVAFLLMSTSSGMTTLTETALPASAFPLSLSSLFSWVMLLGVCQVLTFHAHGLLHPIGKTTFRRLLSRVWIASAMGCAVVVLTEFAWHRMPVSKTLLPVFYVLDCGFLTLSFLIIQRLERNRPEHILLLGPWKQTDYFLRALQTLPSRKRTVFPSPDAGVHSGRLETTDDFRGLFTHQRVDRIYIVKDAFSDEQVLRLLEAKPRQVHVYVVPSTWDSMISRLALGPVVGDLRLFEIRTPLADPFERFLKRATDWSLALVLMVLTLPLQIGIALSILLTDGGPVLFRQQRVGRHGRTFEILKFRTMVPVAESNDQPFLVTENDPRVTPLGRRLRNSRLDELPQFWNVLRGDMALVGPRPERPCLVEAYREELPGYALRHDVRPGITGIAQVYGQYQSHPREKLRFDLAYIFNYSPLLDLTLLIRTAWVAVVGLFS